MARIAGAFASGVDYVQLRTKNLDGGELLRLAMEAARLRSGGKLLVNDRLDVALAAGADGLHLPSKRPSAGEYRRISPAGLFISVACHSVEDVQRARDDGADMAVLAPIFESPGKGPAIGLAALERACRVGIPVLALGGVTSENAGLCMQAGAAGVAGIRMFEGV